MILVTLIFAFTGISIALPVLEVHNRNIITVPPNCPPGQVWVHGQCREIWRKTSDAADLGVYDHSGGFRNVITVPPNCPPGQEFINGACRDVWRLLGPTTPVPKIARNPNQVLRERRQVDPNNRNIINIPNQCPKGYKPDALGNCREILN